MTIINRLGFPGQRGYIMPKMKWVLTGAISILLFGTAAFAQNVHLKPPNSSPAFTDLDLDLRATGTLAGLGNGDILVTLTAQANATATCSNPSGSVHQPPGQNPAPVTVSGSQAIPDSQIKNGTVSFRVTTNDPTTPIPGAPGCPNSSWTEDITDLSFTSAVIEDRQGAGTLPPVVLTVSCTFTPATKDGPVPSGTVSCTVNK